MKASVEKRQIVTYSVKQKKQVIFVYNAILFLGLLKTICDLLQSL